MADIYISSWVNTDHRYWMSRKKTNRADRIRPTPILNRTRQPMGNSRQINFQVKVMSSKIQNRTNTHRVKPKLMSVWTFLEKRNRYFWTWKKWDYMTFVYMHQSNKNSPAWKLEVKWWSLASEMRVALMATAILGDFLTVYGYSLFIWLVLLFYPVDIYIPPLWHKVKKN